jgi:hypothetical protein
MHGADGGMLCLLLSEFLGIGPISLLLQIPLSRAVGVHIMFSITSIRSC